MLTGYLMCGIIHLKLNQRFILRVFSGSIQLLGCWHGDGKWQMHSVRVFLEINHKGRKVSKVGGFFKRVIMVDNYGIQAG